MHGRQLHVEVEQLLLIIFAVRIGMNFLEIGKPLLKRRKRARAERLTGSFDASSLSTLDHDRALVIADATFDDYAEMTLQFGFVSMFIAACPIIPVLALLENIAEIRIDAFKLTDLVARPYPELVQDVGSWGNFMLIMGFLSVCSNAGLMLFTAQDFVTWTVYQQLVAWFVIVVALSAVGVMLWVCIPNVPGHIRQHLERQAYFVERHKLGTGPAGEDDDAFDMHDELRRYVRRDHLLSRPACNDSPSAHASHLLSSCSYFSFLSAASP